LEVEEEKEEEKEIQGSREEATLRAPLCHGLVLLKPW